jgi:hypothetical protein
MLKNTFLYVCTVFVFLAMLSLHGARRSLALLLLPQGCRPSTVDEMERPLLRWYGRLSLCSVILDL